MLKSLKYLPMKKPCVIYFLFQLKTTAGNLNAYSIIMLTEPAEGNVNAYSIIMPKEPADCNLNAYNIIMPKKPAEGNMDRLSNI